MRLHRLTLRDVKGVRERTVDFPDHGVVVIEGPNEVGKSTLLEAFDRLLDPRAKATSRSSRVKELQPVDRDVAPFVEAELTVGGYRLRLAKQWLRNPSTTLEVLSPVREQLSGSAAQDRVDALLSASLDRPLWEALRVTQAAALTQTALTDSGVLTHALDGAAEADLHSPDGAQLLDRVEREHARYFTPTGRASGELRAALTAANEAQAQAVEAHRRLQETEELVARHARLRQRHEALADARGALAATLDRAVAHAEAVQRVVRAHQEAMTRLEHAKERSVRAAADLRDRERTVEALGDAEQQLARCRSSLMTEEERLAGSEERLDALVARESAARAALDSAREVLDRAQADAEHVADVAEVDDLERRLRRLQELTGELERAYREVEDACVTGERLRAVEKADQEVAVLAAQHSAASSVLTLEGLGAELSVRVGEETVLAVRHEPLVRTVDEDVRVEVPGLLRVTVRAAAEDRSRAERLTAAKQRLTSALAAAGASDLPDARARAQRRAEAGSMVTQLEARVADLSGSAEPALLEARLAHARSEVAAHRAQRAADLPLPADVEQARAVVRAARVACSQAALQATEAAAELRVAQEDSRASSAALERLRGSVAAQHERVERERAELERARDDAADDLLEERQAERSGEYARVEAVAAQARRELREADVEGVEARLHDAQAALGDHDRHAGQVRDELLSVSGQVEMASGEGRHEACERALAAFTDARAALQAMDRRARAARQLRRTLQRHRDTAHRAYVRPYAREIERLGRLVYGDSFAVEVGDDLTIAARHLDGRLVPFDQLSGGAKEQLGLLARLAVASLVDPDQGVPVIIDDALGYTDPERLERVGAVFGGPAERAQVILLTCTPQRYTRIAEATTIRLTA